jgi:cobalt-zinc-cadmium efflux system outer membrane protein
MQIEVENFAGSGEFQGFQSAEITIHLSQLIELAGKRGKRVRVAALERDLTAWDYEAAV